MVGGTCKKQTMDRPPHLGHLVLMHMVVVLLMHMLLMHLVVVLLMHMLLMP